MLNLKEALRQDIQEGVRAAVQAGELPAWGKQWPEVTVEWQDNRERGDYASPVALRLAPLIRSKQPLEIVKAIARHMPKKMYVGRLTAAKRGFLNIRLNVGWLTSRLDNVIEEDVCGGINIGRGKRINLEFISANPTGPLTLANCRTAFSVDTLGRVMECAGYNVTREYYINDAGSQITRLGRSVLLRLLQESGYDVELPGDLYQGEYVKELARDIGEKWREDEGKEFVPRDLDDKEIVQQAGEQAAEEVLELIKKTVADVLKIHFDVWTSEKELRERGVIEKTVQQLQKRGVTFSKGGAVYLKTTLFGDDKDRILVKSDGQYAYIAPDIGYHQDKYNRGFDVIVTVVGADHQGHLPKLKAALEMLGNDTSKLHLVVSQWFGLVRQGKPVRLSKRKGEVFAPQDLIREIGYDAARFFLVQHRLDSHMDLDLDLAKERSERNPVYYLQYAYVRLQSILRRAKEKGIIDQIGYRMELTDRPALTHTLELELIRQLYRFPEIVQDIVNTHNVHLLAYYARDMARALHVFYRHVPVLAADNKRIASSRLQLVLAARAVLGRVFDLLGISKPDVM